MKKYQQGGYSYNWSAPGKENEKSSLTKPRSSQYSTTYTEDSKAIDTNKEALKILGAKPKEKYNTNVQWYNSFTPDELSLLQESSYRNKILPAVRANDLKLTKTAEHNLLKKDAWTKENFYQAVQGTPERFRIFKNATNSIEDYINPAIMIGSLAKGLGSAPYVAEQTGSIKPYVVGVGAPLLAGAFMNITGKPVSLANAYKYNPFANKKPWHAIHHKGNLKNIIPDNAGETIQRGVADENAILDLLDNGIVRNKFSAGLDDIPRYKENVYWSSGDDAFANKFNNNYTIIAKNSPELKTRPVTLDDIVDIRKKGKNRESMGLKTDWKKYADNNKVYLKTTQNDPHWLLGYKNIPPVLNDKAFSKTVSEATKWSKNWYNHPETIARIKKLSDKRTLGFYENSWPDVHKAIKNKQYKVYPNTKIFQHPDTVRDYGISTIIDNKTYNFVNRRVPSKTDIKSTVVHEGNHGIFYNQRHSDRDLRLLGSPFSFNKVSKLKKTYNNPGHIDYLTSPVEVYARIMELRNYYGLQPGQKVTKVLNNHIIKSGKNHYTPIDPAFFKAISNRENFRNLFNKLPALAPISLSPLVTDNKK